MIYPLMALTAPLKGQNKELDSYTNAPLM